MTPDPFITYCHKDGEPVWGEFAWVTDEEFFEDWDGDEPITVLKETWVLVSREELVFKPSWWCESCDGPCRDES